MLPLLMLVGGFFAGNFVRSLQVNAQAVDKRINLDTETANPQVKFSGLKVGTSARSFNEGFRESGGWIGKVSFEAENISDQKIIGMEMRIRFPETKATGNQMNYIFMLGHRPGKPTNIAIPPIEPLSFEKGQKMEVSLGPQYENIVRFISKRMSIDEVNKIQIEASFIYFADGTGFRIGQFMRKDPSQENRWIPFEPSEKEDKL